jgi:hypothetical protein
MKPDVAIVSPAPSRAYVVVPTLTILAVSWFAAADLGEPSAPIHYYFLPFWIGLLCAPGYLLAWWTLRVRSPLSPVRRGFAIGSIGIAVICSAAGAVFSAFTVVGGILSAWSCALALMLFLRFARNPSVTRNSP